MSVITPEQDMPALLALVREAARDELLPKFAEVAREFKSDGSIVTAADVAMQQRLQQALAERWPEIPFLGEEMSAAEQQQLLAAGAAGLWCLDPLDGTSNFAAGIPYFAVSLALLRQGRSVLGLVYDPVRDEMFHAVAGGGARCNGARLAAGSAGLGLSRSIAAVDLKRLPAALAVAVASQPPFASQRNFGSSALDWCWLAAHRFHLYLHGGQKLWDYAAGSLILAEAGGQALSLDQAPVMAGQLGPRSVVAALDGGLFREWLEWVRSRSAG